MEQWTNAMTITTQNTIRQHQINLPIHVGLYGIHSYTKTVPAAHNTPWVSVEQTQRTLDSKHTTMKPQSVDEAMRDVAEHHQAVVNTVLQRTWSEVLTGVTTQGMRYVLTDHAHARLHKQVAEQAATNQPACAGLSATEVEFPTLEHLPVMGSWLTCRPKAKATPSRISVFKPTYNGEADTHCLN